MNDQYWNPTKELEAYNKRVEAQEKQAQKTEEFEIAEHHIARNTEAMVSAYDELIAKIESGELEANPEATLFDAEGEPQQLKSFATLSDPTKAKTPAEVEYLHKRNFYANKLQALFDNNNEEEAEAEREALEKVLREETTQEMHERVARNPELHKRFAESMK